MKLVALRPVLLPSPITNFFRNLSPLAWMPFAILWFGVGDAASMFLIFLSVFFPVVLATMAAVGGIPAVYFRVARSYGLRGFEKLIDAYFVGEPHCARAELDGTGRVLYYAKDIWPQFISCVLVAHEKPMRERPALVRDLVRGIAESGEWAESHRIEATKVVSPYFRQNESLVRFVLTKPPDRVSYRMLNPSDNEMQRIADMALKSGLLEKRIDVRELLDRSFIPADIKPAKIDAE